MNTLLTITIFSIAFVAIIALTFVLLKRELAKLKPITTDDNALGLLKQDLLDIRKEIREAGQSSMTSLQSQLQTSQKVSQESSRIVQEVSARLTKLDETNKQVMGFAEQLQSLENILKNPKQRGILGEYNLELLLKSAFTPSQYQMQYGFKDGKIVDAVIFIGEKILPIDSKFSLENYNKIVMEKDMTEKERLEKLFKQDLKNRIEETAKYIRPQENTFDFALMFIPAEGIYYDLMVNEVGAVKANTRDLLEYAVWEKNVHIVSPNSFYAFLQTILQGLKAFEIEKSAKEIQQNVQVLGKHLAGFDQYMKKLGGHLGTACNTYNTAYKELGKIDKDVVKITESKRQIEPQVIDKPNILE